MKTTNATKNMRQRFFYIARRKLQGLFGPCDDQWMRDNGFQEVKPVLAPTPIYTAPTPATQRPANSNAKDRKGYKRNTHGGIIREKGKK